jgi:hypothetical protein
MPQHTNSPDTVTGTYQQLLSTYQQEAQKLTRQLAWISGGRLLLFVLCIYIFYRALAAGSGWYALAGLLLLVLFLVSIRLYDRLQQKRRFYKALVKLNQDELAFLQQQINQYATGREYIDPHHAYSYDLDLFGKGGLYPFLNRCSTGFGKEALAALLLQPDTASIEARQQAIAELKDKLEFRQFLQAHGSLLDTKEKEMDQLRSWLQAAPALSRSVYYALQLFPLFTLGMLVYYFISENDWALNAVYYSGILNLAVAFGFARKISAQLSVSTSVTTVLQQFAGQLKQIEAQTFQSPLLQQLQAGLKQDGLTASKAIGRLSSLFNYLEAIVNLLVSILLNGLFLFHIHILYRLDEWRRTHGSKTLGWLRLLGEVEALNSLANLSYNNPSYCQPIISREETLEATELGHPLILAHKRVNNDVSFTGRRFIILTGSNMSGKSTFLRTLGINLVLARAGAVVCARQFTCYPFAVQVSMRITDSLQDSESFFYAELKKLHSIIHQLEAGQKTLVILDEILRGTNSNDKHQGTIGLIHKLVAAHACGIIATHDLTVSSLQDQYPAYVRNMCFESNIVNDELLFDYKLKDGVCAKLSASFLMKKMGIID